jgi:hypothetical protein
MRDWSLGRGEPLYLTLAADARLCTPDYVNDHIWELELGTGEPVVLALRTTYGLRARSMRMFLRFSEGSTSASDPSQFAVPPRLRRFYPNFLILEFVPIKNLDVTAEFWIPESHTLAGRLSLHNGSNTTRQISLEVCGLLSPLDGHGLTPMQQQLVNVLAGQTSGITPVIFMTGGPKHGPGPHASLLLEVELGPGATRQISFAQAALDNIPASFELARHAAARPWEAERARIELQNAADTLEIYTGDADWDAALAFSQQAALGLFLRGSPHLPQPSFVSVRQPDHGFSHRGDGTDYPASWNGQSTLDSYYMATILSHAPQLTKDLLLNFLATQMVSGEVDNKPGLAGQRSNLLAAPLLVSLAWKIFETGQDKSFLAEVYPKLLYFFWAWFSPQHDRDRNGVPEWDHISQTGFEDNPLFDVWHPWSQGLDISLVQSPALVSMLVREAQCLIRIAREIGKPDEDTALIRAQVEKLKAALKPAWNDRSGLYTYLDRATRFSQPGKVIAKQKGSGSLHLTAKFERPVRLLIEVQTKNPTAKRPDIKISETGTRGEVEAINGHQFQLRTGGLVAVSQKVYARVGRISVRGLEDNDRLLVKTADTSGQDLTMALPLWAGIPSQKQAETMLNRVLLDAKRFGRPFGMPVLPSVPGQGAEAVAMSVQLPWNALIGEGLIAYGFRAEAARLVTHLMKAVIQNLKQNRAFYQGYHAERGSGIGERNALQGLAPVGLFLQALGVNILSPRRVRLEGRNVFPWPVTIKHKGLTVERGLDRTVITFPSGENVAVEETAACIVSL